MNTPTRQASTRQLMNGYFLTVLLPPQFIPLKKLKDSEIAAAVPKAR
jgi:hypothetical protein